MKVLVTGGSGFIGGHLVRQLRAGGVDVRALVRESSRIDELKSFGVELAFGDLDSDAPLDDACRGCKVVYHCAARVEILGVERDFHNTTVEGTRRLLAAANRTGVRRFVQVSSCGVYNPSLLSSGNEITESTPTGEPPDWFGYAQAKLRAEQAVMNEAQPPMEWAIVRLGYIYGPGNRTMETYLRPAMNDSMMMLVGDGSNIIALTYVEDATRAILLAGTVREAAGKILIAGPHEKITQKQYIDAVADGFGVPRIKKRINYNIAFFFGKLGEMLPQRGVRATMMCRSAIALTGLPQHINCEHTRKVLGWNPTTNFEDGIKKAFEWYHREYPSSKR